MTGKIIAAAVVLGLCAAGWGAALADGKKNLKYYTVGEKQSGYLYSMPATQSVQDDDIANGSFLWVDTGEELWSKKEGKAGKACADCHQQAGKSMKGVGATYPKYDKKLGKVINLEQRINNCRKANMQAKPFKYESEGMLGMTAYVKLQSRGMPVNVSIDGPARKVYEKGEKFYNQRRGMLDMACSNCHIDNPGKMIRADLVSQGQSNGFPTYRLKWQKLGSLHRRFRGCNKQVRAKPYGYGSPEYVAVELFLAHKGRGLKIETPSVRR